MNLSFGLDRAYKPSFWLITGVNIQINPKNKVALEFGIILSGQPDVNRFPTDRLQLDLILGFRLKLF